MNPEVEKLEQTYPSVDLAYTFAVASYDVALKRLDIVDNRLQTVLALGATISLSVPALASARGLGFSSGWFVAAAFAFASAMILGTFARVTGSIILINPSRLYNKWLHFSEWEFKKNFICYAGEHFEANRALAGMRGWATTLVVMFFILEGLLLTVWASLPRP
ncbi:MAG TPA: hypothetical protein VHU19_13565 [Pyrinomonadaceae bacterium]|jgi:hypothetical protein|nr:hypothetical protein [Pyrinomonadaceae bacterium]